MNPLFLINRPEHILVLQQNEEGSIVEQHGFRQQDSTNVNVFAEAIKKRFRLREAGLTFRAVSELQSNQVTHAIKDQITWQAVLNRAAQRKAANSQLEKKYRNNRPIVIVFRTQPRPDGPQQQMAPVQHIARAPGTGIPLDDAAFFRFYNLGTNTDGLNIPHHRTVAEKEHPQYAANPDAAQQAYSQHWKLVFRRQLFDGAQVAFRELQRIQFPAEKFNGNDALKFLHKYKYTANGRIRTTQGFKTLAISMKLCSDKALQRAFNEDELESTESIGESSGPPPLQQTYKGAADEWGLRPLALAFEPDELGWNTLPHSQIEHMRKNGEVHGVVPKGMEHTVSRFPSPPVEDEDHNLLMRLPLIEGADLDGDSLRLGDTSDEDMEEVAGGAAEAETDAGDEVESVV